MRRLETTYSTLQWSADGTLVTKARPAGAGARERYRNELRVNRLVRACRPPVPTPLLVGHDTQRRRLTFEAVPGEPLGPKYPHDLSPEQAGAIVDIADALVAYDPDRRWLRRLDSRRRIAMAHRAGLLRDEQAAHLTAIATRAHTKLRFAHGDMTARNVLLSTRGLVLIDWEWAGRYPAGYDHAFLWFSLIDAPASRSAVERRVDANDGFWLSALLIELWHLQSLVPAEFREQHLAVRDELLVRLGCA
jgi:hypothetical protein